MYEEYEKYEMNGEDGMTNNILTIICFQIVCRTEMIEEVLVLLSGITTVWDIWLQEEKESLIRETLLVTLY